MEAGLQYGWFLSPLHRTFVIFLFMRDHFWLGVCSRIVITPTKSEALGGQILDYAFCLVTVFEEHFLTDWLNELFTREVGISLGIWLSRDVCKSDGTLTMLIWSF